MKHFPFNADTQTAPDTDTVGVCESISKRSPWNSHEYDPDNEVNPGIMGYDPSVGTATIRTDLVPTRLLSLYKDAADKAQALIDGAARSDGGKLDENTLALIREAVNAANTFKIKFPILGMTDGERSWNALEDGTEIKEMPARNKYLVLTLSQGSFGGVYVNACRLATPTERATFKTSGRPVYVKVDTPSIPEVKEDLHEEDVPEQGVPA